MTFVGTPADENNTVLLQLLGNFGFWKGHSAVLFGAGLLGDGSAEPWVTLSNGGTYPLFLPAQRVRSARGSSAMMIVVQ